MSIAPRGAGDISRENLGGTVPAGSLTGLLSEVAVHMGRGTVINTSAKQQAVWPICFLLGRRVKRKQWGGVLHTVGD